MPAKQVIVVQVDRVLYRKEDSGWCIISTRPQATDGDAAPDRVGVRLVCKGVVPFAIKEGDRLQLEGAFKVSTFNGETEFCFAAATPHLPKDMLALLHYAVSITKGLGEQRETYIWAKYGPEWINHERLDISGLSETVQENWRLTLQQLSEQKNHTAAIAFLLSKGCTLNLAAKAWEQWKDQTVGIVGGDPYQLAALPYCGFKQVDETIRHHFGITDDDPRRTDAAILYILSDLTASGSTIFDLWQVKAAVSALVPVDDAHIDAALDRVKSGGRIVILSGGKVSMASDVQAEKAIWQRFAGAA